jgi:hypothetical protein
VKQLSISALVREGFDKFRSKHETPNGRDDVALGSEINTWIFQNHTPVIRAELGKLVWNCISDVLRQQGRKTRPTAKEIEAGAALNPQPTLPSFDEIQREWYRPSHGKAVCLADLLKGQLLKVAREYGEGELENRVKRLRLEAIYREMERRGMADTDQVRDLYAVGEG